MIHRFIIPVAVAMLSLSSCGSTDIDVIDEGAAQQAIEDSRQTTDEDYTSDSFVFELSDLTDDQIIQITEGIDDDGNEVYNVCAKSSSIDDIICKSYPLDSATTLCPPHCSIAKNLSPELLAEAKSVSSDQVAHMVKNGENKNPNVYSSFSIPPKVLKPLKKQNAEYVRVFHGKRNQKNVLIIGGYDQTGAPLKDGKFYAVPLDKKKV